MIGYVYKTVCKINNKIYIGQHISEKWDTHYIGSGNLIKKAIIKYGRENFDCVLIEECDTLEQLEQREAFWIDYFNSTDDQVGYNLLPGGRSFYREYETCKKIKQAKSQNNCDGWVHIVNQDDIEKIVRPEQLPEYLANGWQRGRSSHALKNLKDSLQDDSLHQGMAGKTQSDYQKQRARQAMLNKSSQQWEKAAEAMSKARLGKKLVTNLQTNKAKYVDKSEIPYYLQNGYRLGRPTKK